MNQKLKQKILLDFMMIILFTVLLFAFQTGLAFHEIAGLCILFIFCLHLCLNWQWVKKVTLQFFKMKAKIKGMFLLNVFLAVGVTVIVVSGILISQVLFPMDWGLDRFVLVSVHRITSYVCAGLFALHLGLHARYMISLVKKIVAGRSVHLRRRLVGIASLVIICAVFLLQVPNISSDAIADDLGTQTTGQVETSGADDTVPSESSDIVIDEAEASGRRAGQHNTDDVSIASNDEDSYIKPDDETITADDNATVTEPQTDVSTPTLSDYLGNLFCTGCHRHCPLLSPQCSIGVEQAQVAEAQYLALYGDAISDD